MSNLQQSLERAAVAALNDTIAVSRDERRQFRESFRVFLRRLGPLARHEWTDQEIAARFGSAGSACSGSPDPGERIGAEPGKTAAPDKPGAAISA